ncbi:MAG: DUF6384 family protein [Pseudomonadota bacterium]
MTAESDTTPGGERAAPTAPSSEPTRAPLDDVMIAMDVVDTLRHDAYVVERELGEDERKARLIERLREIYRGQGIEVPDRILEEGVQALEEDRFVYNPPADTFETRLARLYVTRFGWGRYVLGGVVAILAIWLAWYALYEAPRQRAATARHTELTRLIPERLKELETQIGAETTGGPPPDLATAVRRGLAAASAGDLTEARKVRDNLEARLNRLRDVYEVRIVSRRGEVSGLWRVPKVNPEGRNYYLVVEAIGSDGKVMPQTILSEETGRRETVKKWAVRVPQEVLERVRADKEADGIVDEPVVATKVRGRPAPDWRITRAGGEITQW